MVGGSRERGEVGAAHVMERPEDEHPGILQDFLLDVLHLQNVDSRSRAEARVQ